MLAGRQPGNYERYTSQVQCDFDIYYPAYMHAKSLMQATLHQYCKPYFHLIFSRGWRSSVPLRRSSKQHTWQLPLVHA